MASSAQWQAESAALPHDTNSRPIQTLSPAVEGTVHLDATEGADDSAALPSETEIVRVACNGAVFIAFGGSGVDAADGQADSFLFTAGVEYFHLRDSTYTWVAARSLTGEGAQSVTVTKMV